MIVNEILNPKSIVVIGASNDTSKPGGKVLKNLIDGDFLGDLFAINPKDEIVQGIKCLKDVTDLPKVELAILAIASKFIIETIKTLVEKKECKAFIILSAGFSEIGLEGKKLEDEVVKIVNSVNGTLIGPNCIGILTPAYKGVFAGPIPKLNKKGCDFVTGSGATSCFILEAAIQIGLPFASLFSVGNSAHIGVEEVLQFWDETFNPAESSKIKIIYIEKIDKPQLLLKHASSLIKKGCKIAAIKAGTTDAGSRAVSSHTGALAGSDVAVDALFKKAGIVRCYSKEELIYVAGAFTYKEMQGERFAVITHAGGPGVMLTDALSKEGLKVPRIEGKAYEELASKLFHGSSVANPIDFLATGTAEQLGIILDYVENKFDNIDSSVVIFGTPGLVPSKDTYTILNKKINSCKKTIYPVLPSLVLAKEDTDYFISLGNVIFPEEVNLAKALGVIHRTKKPADIAEQVPAKPVKIKEIISKAINGYLPPHDIHDLLDSADIPRVHELVTDNEDEAVILAMKLGFPVVMKVVGPVHKTDVGGITLNISDMESARNEFQRLMAIDGANSVLLQPMIKGTELFIGAKYEPGYGHLILCGLGGIFIEVIKDVSTALTPVSNQEALDMIRSLKSYKLFSGVRGKKGIDEQQFADIIVNLSSLLGSAPEIFELDLNPLIATENGIKAVDARIRIEKN